MTIPFPHQIRSMIPASIAYSLCLLLGSILVPTAPSLTGPTNPAGPNTVTAQSLPAESASIANPSLVKAQQTQIPQINDVTHANTIETHLEKVDSPYSEVLEGNSVVLGTKVYPLREYSTTATPNDPDSGQWWEAAINAPNAWDSSTGDSSTILAIIDTGFALQHEEFAGRWHVNSGEMGSTAVEQLSHLNCSDLAIALDESCNLIDDNFDGIVDNETGPTIYENDSQLNCSDQSIAMDKSCNLIDDDGNGLADDVSGWDFINYDRSVQAGETNPNGTATRHGSYVAAVAAGNSNNGTGIAGVNWNTSILPIQAIDDDGYGNSISVARAVNYAVAQGADVISMSLGGAYPDSYLRLSLQNAIAQGVVIVAASGNDGCNCISYPANYPEIIAVGALDYSMQRASFSSYGANLDISAPGVGMYTASWTASNGVNAYASGISGTSLATPLVGGALATLKSLQPTATPLQLTAALLESADQSVLGATEVHSTEFGFGRLDVQAATNRLQTAFSPTITYSFEGLVADDSQDEANIYQCRKDIRGGNAIYTMKSSSKTILSSSLTHVYILQNQGYSTDLLTYACVLQPHDTPGEVRRINTAAELLNVFIK